MAAGGAQLAQAARHGQYCPAIAGRRIAGRAAFAVVSRPSRNCKGADERQAVPGGSGFTAPNVAVLRHGRDPWKALGRLRRASPCWRESSVAMWQAMSRTICISRRPRMDRDGHLLSRSLAATGTHARTTQRRARLRFPPALPFRQRVRWRKDLRENDQPPREGRAGLLSRVDRRNRREHVQVGSRQRRVRSARRGAECAPDCPADRGESDHDRVRPAYVRGAPC